MNKYNYLFLLVVLNSGITLYAQEWTVQDSIWLQRVLEGNEKIRLNEQTLKAIESGTLIRDPSLLPKEFKTSPSEMPIIRSIEDIKPSELPQPIQPLNLPVAVYHIYVLQQPVNLPTINKEAYTFSEKTIIELKTIDALTPRKATVDDPSTLRTPSGGVSVNYEDILRTLFWPSHRAKKRNAQKANAWKNYNEYE